MKQKSRFLAFLLALGLLASLAVTPAAAAGESVEQLKKELAAAEATLAQKRSDFAKAEKDVENANAKIAAPEKAQADVDQAQTAVNEAQAAYDAANSGSSNPDGDTIDIQQLLDALNNAKSTLERKQSELADATSEAQAAQQQLPGLEQAKNSADEAVKAAERDVEAKRDALEEAEKNQANQNPPAVPTGSDLSWPSSVDFGKLGKGTTSDLTRTFTITNRTSYDMVLSASSVSGYTISGASGTLAANSSTTVTVRLDSTSKTGSYNGTLTVNASFVNGTGGYYPFTIAIYAEVVEAGYSLTVSPTTKDFGKLAEGYEEKTAKDAAVTVTLENKGASSVQMNGVKGNDHFTVTAVANEYITLKSGEKTDYKIAPKHGLAVGSYTDTITFRTQEGATVSFKATVVVEKKLAPLTVEPAALNFGTVEEGYTAPSYQTVTVKNNTDRAIILTQPSSYSYEISTLSQTALAAGGSATFSIRPRTGLPASQYGGVVEITGGGEKASLNVQFSVSRPAGPSSFNDVAAGSTFAADIAYVSQKGLMGGVGNGNFNPQAPITRGQLVTILYRLEGQPAVSGLGFSDVAAGSYCEKAVKWAAATGITNGGTDGLFKPNASITREQMATFLYRYNQHKGYFAMKLADLSTFPDASSIASYAKDAMSWANGSGLINGTGEGRLNPSGGATRGQAAAILHRYCVSIGQ